MTWLRKALGLDVIADDVKATRELARDARMYAHNVACREPPKPPLPFVAVLIEGTALSASGGADRGRVFMGQSAHVNALHTFGFQPHWPMRDVRVIVFCDLERVDVVGVFAGVNFLNAVVGECPTARIDHWELGVLLRVQCRPR